MTKLILEKDRGSTPFVICSHQQLASLLSNTFVFVVVGSLSTPKILTYECSDNCFYVDDRSYTYDELMELGYSFVIIPHGEITSKV